MINSLWLSDAIWWQRSDSILAQVMAWYMTAQSHYLKQFVDVSSRMFCGTDLRAISQEVLMNLSVTWVQSLHFSYHISQGANVLTHKVQHTPLYYSQQFITHRVNPAITFFIASPYLLLLSPTRMLLIRLVMVAFEPLLLESLSALLDPDMPPERKTHFVHTK